MCKSFVVIFLLLMTGVVLGAPSTDLDTFFRAVTDGRAEVVEESLEAHPDWLERELFFGIRPLYRASVLGRPEVAQYLIEQGADLSAKTDRGYQPLHAAAQNNHQAIVLMLLAAKAPPSEPNAYGDTPLHLAVRYKRVEVMKELLRNGAEVNVANDRGRTPLHLAAGLGRLDMVTLLVENGAELSPVDSGGYSPLGLARTWKRNSYGDVGGYLEARGAEDIRPQPKE